MCNNMRLCRINIIFIPGSSQSLTRRCSMMCSRRLGRSLQSKLDRSCVSHVINYVLCFMHPRAFHIQEFTSEFSSRLQAVERRLEGVYWVLQLMMQCVYQWLSVGAAEGMKAVEIDRCKQEIVQLKDQFMAEKYVCVCLLCLHPYCMYICSASLYVYRWNCLACIC